MKLKQFLALVLLVFSTCLYAQLLTPTLIGTPQKYSAKGSGVTGIPTIDYPLPAGKNRIIILSMLIERDRTTTNPNILDSNGDTTSIPGWIQMSNATLGFIKLVKNLKQIDLKLSFQKRLLEFDNQGPFWAFR